MCEFAHKHIKNVLFSAGRGKPLPYGGGSSLLRLPLYTLR
jgi:hypothetical protein